MTELQRKSSIELFELLRKSKKLKASLVQRDKLRKLLRKIMKSFGFPRVSDRRYFCFRP